MTFKPADYVNFVAERTRAGERLFLEYLGSRNDFDIIIVGSGIGGGLLADDLAERVGKSKRILVLEAGSYLYPTHAYNFCRFPNSSLAKHFACDTFWQSGNNSSEFFIGEKPQLNFGGRSIFWSGLIPTPQGWEMDYFPERVRQDLNGGLLERAGAVMLASRSMGSTAEAVVARLRQSNLAADFSIQQTPRALHQPYLKDDGSANEEFFTEPTGVFNTAELLINQLGLTPGVSHGDGPGLQLLLNHYVEDVRQSGQGHELVVRNTLTGNARVFQAPQVVLAAGSIESPKLLQRSSLFASLPPQVQGLVGRGLTDHPTTSEITTFVDRIGNVGLDSSDHAKIVFYSRGLRDNGVIRYPFNVEINLNHEYWHLRDNDPTELNRPASGPRGAARVDIKFSFANCLDDDNQLKPAAPFAYVPELIFRNQSWVDHLSQVRLPALAGWQKNPTEIWAVLNSITYRIMSEFSFNGCPARPQKVDQKEVWYGEGGKGFGWGTVHHAAGSLRMPYRPRLDAPFAPDSVVDEDLRVIGTPGLYVCDMSVMPLSCAANPVRPLAALALRLSQHLS
jgi:choline dehydrogenase-like flavoprotein